MTAEYKRDPLDRSESELSFGSVSEFPPEGESEEEEEYLDEEELQTTGSRAGKKDAAVLEEFNGRITPISDDASENQRAKTYVVVKQPVDRNGTQKQTSCVGNCVVSSLLAAYVIQRRCDIGGVAADFAYFPPQPATYRFAYNQHGQIKFLYNYPELANDVSHQAFSKSLSQCGVEAMILTNPGSTVETCCFFIRYPNEPLSPNASSTASDLLAPESPTMAVGLRGSRHRERPSQTGSLSSDSNVEMQNLAQPKRRGSIYAPPNTLIIFAHGNATDCGVLLGYFKRLSEVVEVSVLAVEYSGFGESTGKACAANAVENVLAAYNKAIELGFKPSDIILLGVSVGASAVCRVAASKEVGGLILVSPVASGLLTFSNDQVCSPFCLFRSLDPFNNLGVIGNVRALVWVVHGTADETVPMEHGQRLHDAARNTHPPYWIPNANHTNALSQDESHLFMHLQVYLQAARRAVRENRARTSQPGHSSQLDSERRGSQALPASRALATTLVQEQPLGI